MIPTVTVYRQLSVWCLYKISEKQDQWPLACITGASHLVCVAGAWKKWAKKRTLTSARERDTQGERERLHGRPPKIVSRPQPNYLAPSRAPVLSFAHYFQAPATRATSHSFRAKCRVRLAWLIKRLWCRLQNVLSGSIDKIGEQKK